jgi:hypothetical protein
MKTGFLRSESAPPHFYAGFTENPDARLKHHNSGGDPHTAKYRPFGSGHDGRDQFWGGRIKREPGAPAVPALSRLPCGTRTASTLAVSRHSLRRLSGKRVPESDISIRLRGQ